MLENEPIKYSATDSCILQAGKMKKLVECFASTCGCAVSTRTVEPCLAQSRWMREGHVAAVVTRRAGSAAKGVCQMKTATTQVGLLVGDWQRKQFKCVFVLPQPVWVRPPGAGQWQAGALGTVAPRWTGSAHSRAEITVRVGKVYTLRRREIQSSVCCPSRCRCTLLHYFSLEDTQSGGGVPAMQ